MSEAQRLASEPTHGTAPEQARYARARAWAFIFQCWQEKQKSGPTTALDALKEIDGSGKTIISK